MSEVPLYTVYRLWASTHNQVVRHHAESCVGI